jgi:hypothetical protein
MTASLRNICAAWERVLNKYRGEMKPRTLAAHLSRVALLLFNYEPGRARALAWEGLRLRPFQPMLVAALAGSMLGMDSYRWLFRNVARWRSRLYLGRARI